MGEAPGGAASATLERLRRRIRALEQARAEGQGRQPPGRPRLALGAAPIDGALGGGLPLGCLHAATGPAAAGFAAVLAGRLAASVTAGVAGGRVLWCLPAGSRAPLYPPGLPALGLDPACLVAVLCRGRDEMLRVMEDALGCGGPAAVVGEVAGPVGLTASRRLQLAAEAGGVTGVLVLGGGAAAAAGDPPEEGGAGEEGSGIRAAAAVGSSGAGRGSGSGTASGRGSGSGSGRPAAGAWRTGWRIGPLPSLAAGPPAVAAIGIRWRVVLERNRGGITGEWDVDWDETAHRFTVVPAPGHRPAVAGERIPRLDRGGLAGRRGGRSAERRAG